MKKPTHLLVLLLAGFGLSARAGWDQEIAEVEAGIKEAVRYYKGNYPAGNNDPNPVRRRFLGLNSQDQPSDPDQSARLRALLDQALALRQQKLSERQLARLSKVIHLGLEVSLQGWLICGNVSLLEGLRISYPTGGSQSRPVNSSIPYGCVESQFPFVTIKDSSRAQHFYAEGVRAVASVLASHAGDAQGRTIVDVDTDTIPAPVNDYPGAFANQLFPQYTYYVDLVPGQSTNVVPIQTEAALMGHLLQKQAQATQTIGYRLWTGAYFNSATQRDPAKRRQLLDAAVKEYHAGANLQFLSSVALAAQVGDKAETTAETPFELTKLRNARVNVNEARAAIRRIRNHEKPTLSIDEIMAGDAQVNALIGTLTGTGAGSLARAQAAYDLARNTLFRVQNNQVQAFQEEQTRQNGFYDKLANLTGIPVDPAAISTDAGQAAYRTRIADTINALMNDPNPDFRLGASELVQAVKQVRYHRQEVLNKKEYVDSFAARIKNREDTLGANVSAVQGAEGKITAAQLGIGRANSVSISASASAGYGSQGPYWSAGVTVTYNPGAVELAELQNDITYASNVKEIQFLQNAAAEDCRSLLLEQNQALGALKSQVILLQNAEDDVRRTLGSVDRQLAQLNNFNQLTERLYYNDPTFNQELTAEEEQADRDLDAVVANLYKLGRLLEQRWLEPFANPISVKGGGEPVRLDDPNFDRFWSLESVFSLGAVNVRDNANATPGPVQASFFYSALKKWDETLRGGIRTFDGDLPPVEISLRQDVFELADVKAVAGAIQYLDTNPLTNPNYLADLEIRNNNVRRFKNLLLNHGRHLIGPDNLPVGDKYRGFLLPFSLSYYDVGYTRGRLGLVNLFTPINAWNFRVAKFKVRIVPEAGKQVYSGPPTTSILFAQAGLVSNIDFFERNAGRVHAQRRVRDINLDNYVRYDLEDLNQTENAPYLLFSVAKQNNFPTDAELDQAANMLPRFWSPFCSRWLLEFVPTPSFEIENIDDLVIEITLKSGQPNQPTAWRN